MSQLDNQHRDRFYNKNSFNENLQKYTFCRLLGCLILQFNPLFNYVFKTNLYLGRPLRLLIFVNYFLMISGASLVYFTVEVQSEVQVEEIFIFGLVMQLVIILLRPKVQECALSLFYPIQLQNWGSKVSQREREQRRKQSKSMRMSPRRANLTEDGEDQEEVINLDVPQALGIPEFDEDKRRPNSTRNKRNQLEESNSLDHSGKRLVGDPRAKYADDTMDIILQHANLDSPDNTTDEKDVLGKKKKKRKKKHSAAPELFSKGQNRQGRIAQGETSGEPSVVAKLGVSASGQMKQILNKMLPQSNTNGPQEVEMSDLSQQNRQKEPRPDTADRSQNHDERNSSDLLRRTSDNQEEFSGFAFGESTQAKKSAPVMIDIDLKEQKSEVIVQQQDTQDYYLEEYYEEDYGTEQVEYYEEGEEEQKEGGEEENAEAIQEEEEDSGSSPNPLRYRVSLEDQKQDTKKNSKKRGKSYTQGDFKSLPNSRKSRNPLQHNSSSAEDSSISLESIYKNYRVLRHQPTSRLKSYLGVLLFLLLLIVLLLLHGLLLLKCSSNQLIDWISCTIFTFMALLFLIDVALYSIVTWALLHSKGSIDKRKCCSLFNIMVYWPLGRWKLKELEIEIAKLKDFDKEYPVSALA